MRVINCRLKNVTQILFTVVNGFIYWKLYLRAYATNRNRHYFLFSCGKSFSHCHAALGVNFNLEQAGRWNLFLDELKVVVLKHGCNYDVYSMFDFADIKMFENFLMEHRFLHLPQLNLDVLHRRMPSHKFTFSRCRYELYRKSLKPRCPICLSSGRNCVLIVFEFNSLQIVLLLAISCLTFLPR